MSSEDDTLARRVRRFAQVSTRVGGLAARLAGKRYLGMPLDKRRHAEDLRRALGGLKGPLMKVRLLPSLPDSK